MSLPAEAERDRGELTVRLEPSLAAGMMGGLSYLENFPYECTEQTLSRFLPNLATVAALERLGIQRPGLRTALDEQVATGLQRLFGQQHLDGGWGWWRQDESNLTISAYVVYGLARASRPATPSTGRCWNGQSASCSAACSRRAI